MTYTATKFSAVADKEKFERQFKAFVLSDFAASKFPKWFYTRLSMCFGHIAHYNQGGFYSTFFESTKDKLRFLKITTTHPYAGCGDPAYTYSDVESVLTQWVLNENLIGKYANQLGAENEEYERAMLSHLQKKYGGVS